MITCSRENLIKFIQDLKDKQYEAETILEMVEHELMFNNLKNNAKKKKWAISAARRERADSEI